MSTFLKQNSSLLNQRKPLWTTTGRGFLNQHPGAFQLQRHKNSVIARKDTARLVPIFKDSGIAVRHTVRIRTLVNHVSGIMSLVPGQFCVIASNGGSKWCPVRRMIFWCKKHTVSADFDNFAHIVFFKAVSQAREFLRRPPQVFDGIRRVEGEPDRGTRTVLPLGYRQRRCIQ